jgi:hypothetical protein
MLFIVEIPEAPYAGGTGSYDNGGQPLVWSAADTDHFLMVVNDRKQFWSAAAAQKLLAVNISQDEVFLVAAQEALCDGEVLQKAMIFKTLEDAELAVADDDMWVLPPQSVRQDKDPIFQELCNECPEILLTNAELFEQARHRLADAIDMVKNPPLRATVDEEGEEWFVYV